MMSIKVNYHLKQFTMTNNTNWQVMNNANSANKLTLTEKNVAAIKQADSVKKSSVSTTKKVVVLKRYSFDDNGGGYRGL